MNATRKHLSQTQNIRPTPIRWERVRVFISSTFNDMHAERDYLVKRVFPELREWCERRKLWLVDIDLRWGITEQEAAYNKNVVKICLSQIDECRPFFLCFLGQHRGSVPDETKVSPATFNAFPGVRPFVGRASITELEILHAIISPFHRGKPLDSTKPAEYYEPAKYAFFYLRDPAYLDQLPDDPIELHQTYTNEWVDDPEERERGDQELKRWREQIIPGSRYPRYSYQTTWDPNAATPELSIPLRCASLEPGNIERWQEHWSDAGIHVTGLDVADDPVEAEKAWNFNKRLSRGRLTNFRCEETPLNEVICKNLQDAVSARYPDHRESTLESELEKELDQQEYFLFLNTEGFIQRDSAFTELDDYIENSSNKLFVLTAPGGMGKSMLLANWVEHYRASINAYEDHPIYFRFIGASDRSTTVNSLLRNILFELKETGKFDAEIPEDPIKLRDSFPEILQTVGQHGKIIIILDALNQLETGLRDLSWLPSRLPGNVKLIVSFKRGEQEAEELLQHYQQEKQVTLEVRPFVERDRRRLVQTYLSQYLKELDEDYLEMLISSQGAENPLYLKVVLAELRVFGAFANLKEQIQRTSGNTPVEAFEGLLQRLERDPAYTTLAPQIVVPLIFGLLAHARHGLSLDELTDLIVENYPWPADPTTYSPSPLRRQQARDAVNLYFRQVHAFLARREGRYDFFYESLKIAAQNRYIGNVSRSTPMNRSAEE